jgi:hypothetical protein
MSRQVNFFLSDNDQAELMLKFDQLKTVAAAVQPMKTNNVNMVPITSLSRWNPGANPPVLFRPSDCTTLSIRLSGNGLDFLVDIFDSPAIEFLQCIQRDNGIQRGRLYYTPNSIDSNGYVLHKSPEFLTWANKVLILTKKFCIKNSDGYYVGKHALELVAQGYELRGI